MKTLIARFVKEEEGATAIEYGLIASLIAVAIVAGSVHVGTFRLDAVLNGSVYAVGGFPWSGLVLLGVMLLSFQAFVQR
ncbi:MAG: Flp family type IVb pilin, partial [Alphaproteobacteria bacterium]|nr:Flp family type IVb pilin [Alphaproteobacteria bacterium]